VCGVHVFAVAAMGSGRVALLSCSGGDCANTPQSAIAPAMGEKRMRSLTALRGMHVNIAMRTADGPCRW